MISVSTPSITATPHPQQPCENCVAQHLPHGGRLVPWYLCGDRLLRRLQPHHFIRLPRKAICFDAELWNDLRDQVAGITAVDVVSGRRWHISRSAFEASARHLNYGYGDQLRCDLNKWLEVGSTEGVQLTLLEVEPE